VKNCLEQLDKKWTASFTPPNRCVYGVLSRLQGSALDHAAGKKSVNSAVRQLHAAFDGDFCNHFALPSRQSRQRRVLRLVAKLHQTRAAQCLKIAASEDTATFHFTSMVVVPLVLLATALSKKREPGITKSFEQLWGRVRASSEDSDLFLDCVTANSAAGADLDDITTQAPILGLCCALVPQEESCPTFAYICSLLPFATGIPPEGKAIFQDWCTGNCAANNHTAPWCGANPNPSDHSGSSGVGAGAVVGITFAIVIVL
jgi:hypothetical protein